MDSRLQVSVVMNELRHYLTILLDHQCEGAHACAECESLRRIYAFMQTEIFSSVVFSAPPAQAIGAGASGRISDQSLHG
jgi:hypothetical protein